MRRTPLAERLGLDHPIIQAPMAGSTNAEIVVAVSRAGGLGSLGCAAFSPEETRAQVEAVREGTSRPFNLNFFCHAAPGRASDRQDRWLARLDRYYAELGVDRSEAGRGGGRAAFDEEACELVVEARPAVVSFHFGLPAAGLVERVKDAGCLVLCSATTVAEARWLEERGCDAVIAQGLEAGGHRGMFLTEDVDAQVGTMALVPQVVDAVEIPVIAAGGISDARGIVAALALGASAVQMGTAYLLCPEARISPLHREALLTAHDDETTITNVFTGRPARGLRNRAVRELGPLAADAPPFPLGVAAITPLRAKAEAEGSGDFSPLWSGQAASLCRPLPAGELTRVLAAEAADLVRRL